MKTHHKRLPTLLLTSLLSLSIVSATLPVYAKESPKTPTQPTEKREKKTPALVKESEKKASVNKIEAKEAEPIEKHNIVLFNTSVETLDLKSLGKKINNALSDSAYNAKNVEHVDTRPQTMSGTLKRFQCKKADLDCLKVIGARYTYSKKTTKDEPDPPEELVFAELTANPNSKTGLPALLRLARYSLKKRSFSYDKEGILLDPDSPSVDIRIKTLTDTLFNGDVGQLNIQLKGDKRPSFKLYIDDKEIIDANKTESWSSDTLPLGPHTVRVSGAKGEEKQEVVFLNYGQPVTLSFDTSTIKAPPPPPIFSSPYQFAAWSVFSIGLGGLLTGIAGSVVEGSARGIQTKLCSEKGRAFCPSRNGGLGYLANEKAAERYLDSLSLAKKGQLIEIIGYTTGVVGLLAAGTLFYFHIDYLNQQRSKSEVLTDDTEQGEPSERLTVSIVPGVESIYASGTLYF